MSGLGRGKRSTGRSAKRREQSSAIMMSTLPPICSISLNSLTPSERAQISPPDRGSSRKVISCGLKGREIASSWYNFLVRIILGSRLFDHQCGFKAFNKERIISRSSRQYDQITGSGIRNSSSGHSGRDTVSGNSLSAGVQGKEQRSG